MMDRGSADDGRTIRTAGKPRAIAATPDGRRLYVSDQPSGSLVVVDLAAREVSERIPVGKSPEGVGISRDGEWIAVAVEENNSVSLIRAAAPRERTSVRVSGQNPQHPGFSPDGKWLYVSAEDGAAVDVIDVAKRSAVKLIKVGERPRGIGFLPDGSRAYVAAENSDRVYVIDCQRPEGIAVIAPGQRSHR